MPVILVVIIANSLFPCLVAGLLHVSVYTRQQYQSSLTLLSKTKQQMSEIQEREFPLSAPQSPPEHGWLKDRSDQVTVSLAET